MNENFEMMNELVDIYGVEETGYKNVYDIFVTDDNLFLLDNGIVSHNSATAGLIGPMGREECGFFELKGKPLNAFSASTSAFTSNVELKDLFQVIQNENYQRIVMATDQDLDGLHIRGLLIGFFEKYLSEYKNKIGILSTPVIGIKRNNKLVRWTYSLKENLTPNAGETSKYYKGLGSLKESDLNIVIAKDGLDKMIETLEFDSLESINEWMGDESNYRKQYIQGNTFNIAKL